MVQKYIFYQNTQTCYWGTNGISVFLKTNIYLELEVYIVEEDDNNDEDDDKEEKEEDDYPLKEPIMGYVWLLAVGEGQVCCERQGPSSLIDYPATNGPRAPQKESTVRSKPLNT